MMSTGEGGPDEVKVTGLAGLRAVVEAATPGPWEVAESESFRCVQAGRDMRGDGRRWPTVAYGMTSVQRAEDAEFIATFDPPTVRALLDVLETAAEVFDTDSRELGWDDLHDLAVDVDRAYVTLEVDR